MIHRQALATKNIINPLRDVLKQIIKLVNYVKRGAINSWFFKKTRKEMDSEHQHLLFYTTMCKNGELRRAWSNKLLVFQENA